MYFFIFVKTDDSVNMYLDKEKGEIVFGQEDIVKMLTPMMDDIMQRNRELHDSHVAPRSIFIPIEDIKLIGLQIRTH